MHHQKTIRAAVLSCVAIFTGCATIMNHDMVTVPVYTTPSGATVIVNGATYTTPTSVMVPRGKGNFTLRIEKAGYQPVDLLLTQSVDAWVWGNVVFGGLVGIAIDFISGDAYDLDPELISADMIAVNAKRSTDGALQFVLVDINSLPPDTADRIRNTKR